MKIIAGLGNPGMQYAQTRHNIGFWVIDSLCEKWEISLRSQAGILEYGKGRIQGEKVLLLKPLTYMNESGRAIQRAFVKLAETPPSLEDLLVVHDEIDLPLGRIKMKQGGGGAGHKGIASIDAAVGSEYLRIRLGVGRPEGRKTVTDFVLEPFTPDQKAQALDMVVRACEGVEILMQQGLRVAQNHVHRK